MLSSSSYRGHTRLENHHATNISCMSGIFHFVSKYSRRRKLLTSAEKNRRVVSSPAKPDNTMSSDTKRFSCNVERSPTIPSEIRQSSPHPCTIISPKPAAEQKRQKLLEALKKCDEDLKSLKRMVEAIQLVDNKSTEVRKQHLERDIDCGASAKKKRCLGANSELPISPVSVLQETSYSAPSPLYRQSNGGECKEVTEGCANWSFFHKESYQCECLSVNRTSLALPFSISIAKVEIVNEVYQDVWEESWELERIGLLLEDYMFGDLIEETVKELGWYTCSLPFDACRRKLFF